ncbi:MAG: aminopeptidase P family protein [Armatimonadetes bacterium]|nr:aminopeptidase P family protein [Armatimonadota bacterium]
MTRLARLQAALAEADHAALLIQHATNISYLTGFTGSTAALLVTPEQTLFLTDGRYRQQAERECGALDRRLVEAAIGYPKSIAEAAGALGLDELTVEAEYTTCTALAELRDARQDWNLLPAPSLVQPLRRIKDPDELSILRRACSLADRAFDYILTRLRPGVQEREAALDLEFWMRREGAEAAAFEIIVASGPRSALPHGRASERRLEPGDFITMDFGARLEGYNSDLTRSVVLGPASSRQREVYDALLAAQVAALGAIRAGVDGKAVDALVRERLKEQDLDQYFTHSLGHGLGRDVHESPPLLSPRTSCILSPGHVVTVEPGVYVEGWGGIRIEDDVVVTETGCEVLTHAPKSLLELPL